MKRQAELQFGARLLTWIPGSWVLVGVAMKYAFLLVIGGVAAAATFRRFFRSSDDYGPSVGSVSARWLLTQRGVGGDDQ